MSASDRLCHPDRWCPHGRKATYDRHRCRCNDCQAANAEYMREYRQAQRYKREAAQKRGAA